MADGSIAICIALCNAPPMRRAGSGTGVMLGPIRAAPHVTEDTMTERIAFDLLGVCFFAGSFALVMLLLG